MHAATVGAALTGLATPASLCAWVKTTDANGNVASFGGGGQNCDRSIGIVSGLANSLWTEDDGSGNLGCNGTSNVDDDAWHHLALTWDGTTLDIYVDGTSEDSVTPSAGSQTFDDFSIGRRVRGGLFYLAGAVAEVLVFDRGLTAAEVTMLYGGGYHCDPRPLQPRDAFAVAAGDTMRDLGWAAAALTLAGSPALTAGGPNG